MHTPTNKLIVRLEKKLYNSRTFESGQTIHFDPSWHPEEYAMLKATVVSLPKAVTKRCDYEGYKLTGIEIGDEILIRYDVVFAYEDQPDRDTPRYKNLVFQLNEELGRYEELWLCDILQVFAVMKGSEFNMLNDFVMLEILTEEKEHYSSLLIRPDNYNNLELRNKAKVKAVRDGFGVAPGDIVYINPKTVMQYQLNMERFYILKANYLLGIER